MADLFRDNGKLAPDLFDAVAAESTVHEAPGVMERRFRSRGAWDTCRRLAWPGARHGAAQSTITDERGMATLAEWSDLDGGRVAVRRA